jgi:hypothetical protein
MDYDSAKYEAEHRTRMRKYARQQRWDAIKSLFRKKITKNRWYNELTVSGWLEEFTELPWYSKAFYWFKALCCLLLNRTGGSYLVSGSCQITFWNLHPSGGEYSGYDWTAIWIMPGVFSDWNVCIAGDSSY